MAAQPDDPSLEATLAAVRRGDRGALETVLQRHLPALHAWLERRAGAGLRTRESISDLAQSVCREVLHDLDDFEPRGEASFRNWLIQQAERKLVDRHRYHYRQARDPGRLDSDVGSERLPGRGQTPSQVLASTEETARIRALVAALPDDQAEAIFLHRIEGLEYPDIADRLGRSEAAVRALVARGLATLAGRL